MVVVVRSNAILAGRRAGRGRIAAPPLQQVGPVDSGRAHLDQHLAGARRRISLFGDLQRLSRTRTALDLDKPHVASLAFVAVRAFR